MFCILKSRNFAGKPSFCTTRAYFLAANRDCSSLEVGECDKEDKSEGTKYTTSRRTLPSKETPLKCTDNSQYQYRTFLKAYLLAPVQTIFPELKMRAVVLGSRILMMTAAKRYARKWHQCFTATSNGSYWDSCLGNIHSLSGMSHYFQTTVK